MDGLLHVADISWGRVNKPSDVLTVGDSVDVQVLKVDPAKRRISLGMKQLAPDPWTKAGETYKAGERVRGVVTRVTDFGAFVELEPGLEGLIHLSEMSWTKKARKPSDVVKPGESVEVVVLGVSERRVSLGLKQALGDPWAEIEKKYPAGTVVEGPVTSLTKFGAFVELGEGVEGHDPRRRHQRREADQPSAGSAQAGSAGERRGARCGPRKAANPAGREAASADLDR